ncbi:hypothetical protein EJD97_005841 [Solanum chilense]|uniref:Avr9/Cf-9 rapidly elicited protein 75 n=1 Tax=Solanum chilense TaxID=4083 RepID=A0A6N2AL74_SOLCI|nr:hypothetical protein EJD97_005841 [Solanum chilense]
MIFIEPQVICKKHQDHKQNHGVCSCCLRERLIKLSTNSTTTIMATSSSSSSKSSTTCGSPRGHRRINSDVVGPFSFIGTGAGGGLKKSRSMAFVARSCGLLNEQKKKEGFWSKLIKSTGKRSKRVLVH